MEGLEYQEAMRIVVGLSQGIGIGLGISGGVYWTVRQLITELNRKHEIRSKEHQKIINKLEEGD